MTAWSIGPASGAGERGGRLAVAAGGRVGRRLGGRASGPASGAAERDGRLAARAGEPRAGCWQRAGTLQGRSPQGSGRAARLRATWVRAAPAGSR